MTRVSCWMKIDCLPDNLASIIVCDWDVAASHREYLTHYLIAVNPILSCLANYFGESDKRVEFSDGLVIAGDRFCMVRRTRNKFLVISRKILHEKF